MATFRHENVGHVFPAGTSVGAYNRDAFLMNQDYTKAPAGPTAEQTATVGPNGGLTITGLLPGVRYVLYAQVGTEHRYLNVPKLSEETLPVEAVYAAAGDATIIPARPGKRIRVEDYLLSASANTVVRFRSAANNLTGPLFLAANGGISHPREDAAFETRPGEALILNSNAVATVGGHITYTVV